MEGPGLGHGGVDADDVERLLPATVPGRRFDAHVRQGIGDVLAGGDVAGAAGAAALHGVVGQVGEPGVELGCEVHVDGLAGAGGEDAEKRNRECESSFGHGRIVARRQAPH